ncbi:SRPBCC domain-containing protein [Mucilaginibacter mali]|uniref:SRPBCC domain-containing protein n=1 Tax=Mucilaginibacter mali TaxID=2740462 RepID=A0A7D4PX47_9SPHI|nr:SRPBCC domain-containing protein [Mucilaginibacter mali]QKJ32223.1 SRPBCC domain-containing protein [Mucilaginibacter mali]
MENTKDRELKLTRLLDAPVELVWEVWASPEHIANWWGPEGFTNTIHHMDFRPGGDWEFTMHGPDGTDYNNKNTFVEVVENRRVVYEHVSTPKHLTTVTFEAQGDKTVLTWHMLFESREQLEQVVKVFKADVGLKQNVERMNQYLINRQ